MRTLALLARSSLVSLFVAGLASASAGCAEYEPENEDIAEATDEIIGGSAVNVATRRAQGLVGQGWPECSGSLISHDWVLTATHCLSFGAIWSNGFSLPRADGTTEHRSALAIEQVGGTDISLVQLEPAGPGSEWPNVTREMYSGNPSDLVGQNITCYGQGYTEYDTPDGLTGLGIWRELTRTVSSVRSSDGALIIEGDDGDNIMAPGDSGGGCFVDGKTVAVVSSGTFECADDTNKETCKGSITKMLDVATLPTTRFKRYIEYTPLRPDDTATFRPLTPQNGWARYAYGNQPAAAVVANTVHLRGAIATSGTNPVPFTLPTGYRPSADVYVPVNMCSSTKGRLVITPDGVVTVATDGGPWLNAQCLTSLDGVSFAIDSTGATPLTPLHGWSTPPFTRPAAARVDNGVVRLQGAIRNGSSTKPFTLDVGFRPVVTTYIPVDLCAGAKGRLIIQTDGTVDIQAYGSFSEAQCFTSLEGVSFTTDGGFLATWPQNGWGFTPYGTGGAGVKNVDGIVRFSGAIQTSGTNSLVFTLPGEYSPATDVYISVDMCNAQKGRLHINPSGQVHVHAPSGDWAAAQCFTSLEGAWFGL